MEKMLSLTETAERLGLCSESIRRLVHSGKLPGYRVGPRKLVVPEAAVETYLVSSKMFNPNEKDISDK